MGDEFDFLKSLAVQNDGLSDLEASLNLPVSRPSEGAAHDLARAIKLASMLEERLAQSGVDKWFSVESGYPISTLPKHAAFFAAGKEYPERLFMASNRCHVAGTKVWMADGSEKKIEEVLVGEQVLVYDKQSKSLVPGSVVDTFAGIGDNVVLYHTPTSNRFIASTDDHPFLVCNQNDKMENKKASELRYWDKVVIPSKWEMAGVDPGFSPNVAKLLGLLVGDGYLCAKEDQFKLTNIDSEVLDFAETVARDELGLDVRRVVQRGYTDIYFPKPTKTKGTSALGKLLKETGLYGTRSGNKFVPKQILLAPEEHVRAFVQGLLAADGHYKKGRILLHTTSALLAQTFEKACLRLGAYSNYYVKTHDNPNHADCYVVSIVGDPNLLKIGDAIHKKVILRGVSRQRDGIRTVALKKKTNLPKQEIYCITVDHPDHLFVANGYVNSNSGKTVAGAFETTCHLTGNYPKWWPGRTFDHATDMWAVGPDARTVRDTIQKELLGGVGSEGTGMIPASAIGKSTSLQGVPGAIDTVRIKHKSGGWSTLGFKNYKQDIQAFMGTSRHGVWVDEECPIEIWNECNIRTATTKGIMYGTFTPLQGLTRMVINFCKHAEFLCGAKPIVAVVAAAKDGEDSETVGYMTKKAVIQAGWSDVPWLDEETKARLLADTPDHLKDARSKGIPSMEAGNVYTTPIESILCNPFTIPDNWPRMYGMDVGWNVTTAVWGALDPNSDTVYIYDEHYGEKLEPYANAYQIKKRGDWITGAIDPASLGSSSADGKKLFDLYRKEGLKLRLAKNERESGIQAISQRLATGRLRVFRTVTHLQAEYMTYRRKVSGVVVDEDDHVLDALRYVVNNMTFMSSKAQATPASPAAFTSARYDV